MIFFTGAVPKNTQRRNKWDYNTFQKWAIERNNQHACDDKGNNASVDIYLKILIPLAQMENDVLNYWLSKFIEEFRKESLEEYLPNSLFSMLMDLQGYLRLQGRTAVVRLFK